MHVPTIRLPAHQSSSFRRIHPRRSRIDFPRDAPTSRNRRALLLAAQPRAGIRRVALSWSSKLSLPPPCVSPLCLVSSRRELFGPRSEPKIKGWSLALFYRSHGTVMCLNFLVSCPFDSDDSSTSPTFILRTVLRNETRLDGAALKPYLPTITTTPTPNSLPLSLP